MATKKRKIGFYFLTLSQNEDDNDIQDVFNQLLAFINSRDKIDRKQNISSKKFGIIDAINSFSENTRHRLLFKSATHSFRPPLIDKTTVEERRNPKTIDEGETQKTHLLIKYVNGEIVIALERHFNGMTIKQIVDYFNHFAFMNEDFENIRFDFETLLKDNFLEEVSNLDRVVSADVFIDKQLLGGDALNFSERINSVQHEVKVSIKAKRLDSIMDVSRDIYSLFSGGSQSINKIRLVGRNTENNIVTLNTDMIERQEYVMATVNEVTGEIVTSELFIELETILHNYN